MSTGTAAAVREYDLVTALRQQAWLKLPLAIMQDVGPAVQTFGGLLRITARETYVPVSTIADHAWLPIATVRKHLATLETQHWITNGGRERTRRGAPRRSCTLRVTSRARGSIEPYSVLPWWSTTKTGGGTLTWSSKAVLSVVMSRLAGLVKTVEDQEGKADLTTDDFWASLDNLNGDDRRWLFSLDSLRQQTGLSDHSIIAAKNDLAGRGIVRWTAFRREDGGYDSHALEPREDFRIRVRPAGEQSCYVDWIKGK